MWEECQPPSAFCLRNKMNNGFKHAYKKWPIHYFSNMVLGGQHMTGNIVSGWTDASKYRDMPHEHEMSKPWKSWLSFSTVTVLLIHF